MKVAVLITCFNRKMSTIRCFDALVKSIELLENKALYSFDVWLNDDGSTDGTGAAVQDWYSALNPQPSTFNLNLIRGSGSDYWCGGMRRAWQAAIDSGINYDGYLWLNDDTMLYPEAFDSMMSSQEAIIVGAVQDAETKELTYSGRGVDGQMLAPNGSLQSCVMMNGNAVYIPKKVFDVLGNFPDYFTHSLGDYDYARRAVEHGIQIFVTPRYVGTCSNAKAKATWIDSSKGLANRLRALYSPLSGVQPRIFFRHNLTHVGLLQALHLWFNQHLRVLLPRLWE